MSETTDAVDDELFEVEPVLPDPIDMYHPVHVFRVAARIRRYLRDADVVHSFITYPYLPAAAVGLLGTSTPLFASALGTYAVNPLNSRKTGWLLRYGYRRCEEVLCISDYTCRRIESLTALDRVLVVPLGVDTKHYGTEQPCDERFILCVGSLKKRKGQDILLRAFDAVAEAHPDITLTFAGPIHEESYKDELDDLIEARGLSDRVQFLGMVEEERLQALYRDCTFFALTPRIVNDNFEGFGLVYLEAGAFSKPSVATRSGGVPTAVVDGETGILAPPEDVGGVADALEQFLADDDLRSQYGKRARDRAEALSWDRYADTLLDRFHDAHQSRRY